MGDLCADRPGRLYPEDHPDCRDKATILDTQTQAARLLRDEYGQDAVHVTEAGLQASPDSEVAARARSEGRAVVTENAQDLAAEPDVILVLVLKKNLPAGGALAPALAEALDRWTAAHPDPYVGVHWLPAKVPGPRGG